LLGSVIINPSIFPLVNMIVKAEDFYLVRNQWIWETFGKLTNDKRDIDALTISIELEKAGRLEEVGGAAYIAGIMNNTPHSFHAESYARMIYDYSVRRKILSAASGMAQAAHDGNTSVSKAIDETTSKLHKLNGNKFGKIPDMVDAACELMAYIRSENLCVPTGIPPLDFLMGGLEIGTTTTLAGRTGRGKTGNAMQIGQNAVMAGKRVLYFSLEMKRIALLARRICGLLGITWRDIISKRISEDDIKRIEVAAIDFGAKLGENFLIEDTTGLSADDIYSIAYREKPNLVIIDQLGIVGQRGSMGGNENLRIGVTTWKLHDMAKELDPKPAVLMLCQLNRYGQRQQDETENRIPELTDLRDSGNIEQDSDNVIFIHWPKLYNTSEGQAPVQVDCDLWIKKFRMGAAHVCAHTTYNLKEQWFYPKDLARWGEQKSRMELMEPSEKESIPF
jgi:replicative DNA helicase